MKSIKFDNEIGHKIKMKIANQTIQENDKKFKGILLNISKNGVDNTTSYTLKEANELYKLLGEYFSPTEKSTQ